MRKSAKKQQTQVQTIQKTVTGRNVVLYKQILERQSLVLLLMPGNLSLFLTTGIRKTAVWKTTFVSEHLDTVQSQSTKCFALVACFACFSLGHSS